MSVVSWKQFIAGPVTKKELCLFCYKKFKKYTHIFKRYFDQWKWSVISSNKETTEEIHALLVENYVNMVNF